MSLLRNRETRFRLLLPKVAGFLLLALVALGLLLTALGLTRRLFVPTTELHVSLPDSRGIREGTAVMLRGFRIGTVQSLELDPVARVDAKLSVETRYLVWLGQDSRARKGSDNLLGDTYLDLEPRKNGAPLVAGDSIVFAPGGEMDDLVAEAQAKVFPLLEHADTLVQQFADPKGSFQSTLTGLQQTSQRLDRTLENLDRTLAATEAMSREGQQALRRDLQPVLADSRLLMQEARQTSTALTAVAERLQTALPELTLKIGQNLDAMQQLMPQVSETTATGNTLLQSAQDSLDGLSRSWPLDGLLAPAPTPVLPQDSHD